MIEKNSELIDVIMKENILIFSDDLITLLNAKVGDRINIGYIEKDDKLTPIISVESEVGNKLTGSNTISFRGKQREVLAQFGSNFWATKEEDRIYLKGDGIPVFTSVKKAVDTYLTKEIIEDTNYNITKLDKYEF